MIINPRKNSVFLPRVWRGFGQDNSTESSQAHTSCAALPTNERHFFRERISSISGMLQNATRNKLRTLEGSTNLDSLDMPISYSFSTRPSIDSLNLHSYLPIEYEETNQQENTNLENENRKETDCSDRTKKCFKGLLLTIVISHLWASSLHLIKLCYINQDDFNLNNYSRITIESNTQSTFKLEDQLFDHVVKLDTANNQYIPIFKNKFLNTTKNNSTRNNLIQNKILNQKSKFNAPFFMAWYCSMFNILFLPIFTFFRMCCYNRQNENVTMKRIFLESIHHFVERGFTWLQFFTRCSLFCTLWTLTNYLLIYTIRKLDTTVSIALYACSINIAYLLSWVVLHQQFVGIRVVAFIICDTGIALLAYMNHVDRTTVLNVVLATCAAGCAAIYKVFYKRIIGYTTFAQTSLFFTIVGFLNGFLLLPIVALMYFTGIEIFTLKNIPWLYLTGAALLNLLANLLGNFGVLWTYEIFLTLGILFAIPISFFIDTYLYAVTFQGKKLSGVILIGVGFLIVLLPDNWNKYLAQLLRSRLSKWKRKEQKKKNAQNAQDTTTAQLSRLRTPSGRVK